MKKNLTVLLAVLMALCMSVMAFAANANDTSFTADWTDEADDTWATTDDTANADNVDIEIKDGVAALVLTGKDTATSGHDVGAWYNRVVGNAAPGVIEIDFSVSEGGFFQVRGYTATNGGLAGATVDTSGKMWFIANYNYNLQPDTDVTVTPDTVHTLRIENYIPNSANALSESPYNKYYIDNVLIYTAADGSHFTKFSICAGQDTTVKVYEIREYGAIATWGSNCGVTVNFSNKTIEELETEGRLTGIGTSDADVTAEIVNQTDDAHLALDRVGFTKNSSAALASAIYTLPSPAVSEEYNLNIDFMYKGKNAPEFRLCSGDAWFTQMRIYDGKLQISTSGANKYDVKDDVYLAPFTNHTLTINGVPSSSGTKFAVLLDGRVVAENLGPISGGHTNTLPQQIQIYAHQQSVLNSISRTNMYLMGGYYIKSITVTDPNAEPDMAPVILDDRELRFDGKGENLTASMRFKASVTPAQKLASAECGMLVTRKSFLTELDEELTFDLGSDYYAYGVAYTVDDNGEPIIDKIVENDDDGNEIFAAVITGIENTNEAQVNEVIVVRPYIKVINGDGVTCFYGNTVEASLVEIAAVIDTDELTDEQMANINSILALAK